MRHARCRVAVRAALPLGPERAAPYVHRRVAVYGVPSSEGHQRVPHAPKRPDGVPPHAGLSPEELQELPLAMHAQLPGAPRPIGVDIRLFGGSCGLTPRRIASQQCTQVPHSATGDSRKDALWECHSHGKAHFACGPHQKARSACGRSRRVRLSVRVRAQNAPFRRVRFSLPAQTWSHLTEKRILRRPPHVKAQSAPAGSRKSAPCNRRRGRDVAERRTLDGRRHGKAHFACGPHQRAHSACGRGLRREAVFADPCTLLHTHGRSRDRAGATGPTTSKAP